MPSTGTINLNMSSNLTGTTSPYETAASSFSITPTVQWQNGTGAGQCDKCFSAVETATAAPKSVVLSGDPTRKDGLGNQLAMKRLKVLYVLNMDPSEAKALTVGGGTQALIPAQEPIGGGAMLLFIDLGATGLAVVTTGSADTLKFDPGPNTIQFAYWIAGASA